MGKSDGFTREYNYTDEAWYFNPRATSRREVAEVMFGMYHEHGGTSGEMAVRWYDLGGKAPSPKLEVFDDAWAVLGEMQDVVAWLAAHDSTDPTPRDFMDGLRSLGFSDATPREPPHGVMRWDDVDDDRTRERLAATLNQAAQLLGNGSVSEALALLNGEAA